MLHFQYSKNLKENVQLAYIVMDVDYEVGSCFNISITLANVSITFPNISMTIPIVLILTVGLISISQALISLYYH